jgi:hypothetical protein
MHKLKLEMTRKQFLTAAAGFVGVVVACADASDEAGSDGDGPEECSADGEGNVAAEIGSNHGHTLKIPFADLEAGATKVYTLIGPHEHTIEIDALVFEKLMTEREATVSTSSTDGHNHFVDLSC